MKPLPLLSEVSDLRIRLNPPSDRQQLGRIVLAISFLFSTSGLLADESTMNKHNALECNTVNAKAGCLSPRFSADYYAEQSIKYFRTMQSNVSIFEHPNYAPKVIRWEWPPWLYLTGYRRFNLIWTDVLLKLFPTSYDLINCQGFDEQPFGRCHVVFNYSGELCPIYEEFTFNDAGEITFIEAWSDYESLLPMNMDDEWAQGEKVKRLSTKVPGLGNKLGQVQTKERDSNKPADEDLDNLMNRLAKPYSTYFKELKNHKDDVMTGCQPPK